MNILTTSCEKLPPTDRLDLLVHGCSARLTLFVVPNNKHDFYDRS